MEVAQIQIALIRKPVSQKQMHPPIALEGDSQTGESPGAPFGGPIDFLSDRPLPGLSLLVGRETGLRRANRIGEEGRKKEKKDKTRDKSKH